MTTTLKLGSQPVELREPKSYASAWDIVSRAGKPSLRVMAAAIGVCWARCDKLLKVSLQASDHDVMAYGGAIIDALKKHKVPTEDIITVGSEALGLCARAVAGTSDQEVSAAEGFTEEQEP